MSGTNIESTLKERRMFPPSREFSARAAVPSMDAYEALYRKSLEDPDAFWSEIASELTWFQPWERVLEWEEPFSKWFVGGRQTCLTIASIVTFQPGVRTESRCSGRASLAMSVS